MARAVLFDLDDTLFDHRRSARAALTAVHAAFASEVDFAAFERHHAHYLEEMHLEVLAGRVGLDDARRERFRRVFAALGVALDRDGVERAAHAYRDGYAASRQVMGGAAELLAALRPHARIVIVTNNLLDEQRNKIEVCGLTPLVDVLVASEDVGVAKPEPEIFRIALARAGAAAHEAVMVGDSWANDIRGARAAGIRAIWFNPSGRLPPFDAADVPVITALAPAVDVARIILSVI